MTSSWRWPASQRQNKRPSPSIPISVYIDIRVAAAAGADDDCVGFRFNKYIPGSLQPSITVAVANDRRNKSFAHHTIRYYGDEPKDFFKWFSFLFPPPAYIVSRRFLVTWEPPEGNRWTHHFLREQFRLSLTLWVVGRGRSVPWVCSAAETFHVDTPVSPRLMLRGFIPLVADITKFSVKIPPWPCQRTFFMKLGRRRGTQQWDLSWIAEDFDPHSTLTWLHSRNYTFV